MMLSDITPVLQKGHVDHLGYEWPVEFGTGVPDAQSDVDSLLTWCRKATKEQLTDVLEYLETRLAS